MYLGLIWLSISIKVYIIPNIVMVWKGFLHVLSCPYLIPSFKGVPDNIQLDYQPIESKQY